MYIETFTGSYQQNIHTFFSEADRNSSGGEKNACHFIFHHLITEGVSLGDFSARKSTMHITLCTANTLGKE